MPLNLDAYWMPFTANQAFKRSPRMLERAEGMHYWTPEGRRILDGTAGLWCVNAGHARPRITQAIAAQAAKMDYAPPFQMAHADAFRLAERLTQHLPPTLKHVFFTTSGSEAVESALKIALAYHRANGEAHRTRLIGRERGYHGVNFGGTAVGGMGPNRKWFGSQMAGVDHLRHTHDLGRNAFSRGQPEHGAELADDLERLISLHDASTIAAVIVEPVAGSTGALMPPQGYLQRLRQICSQHGIVLIFDEVITGFGRLGAPFAAQHYEVTPDLMTMAKGITNGCVPMGAVACHQTIHQTIIRATPHGIELPHGYTYSAHPLACAAALATLDTYEEENLFSRASSMSPDWEDMLHSLADLPFVIDIRNTGLVGAIELAPRMGAPVGSRAFEVYLSCWEAGLLVRTTGDTIALSPPLIIERQQIHEMGQILSNALRRLT
ncbi:MAG: aspartate aminotransferase family protein [Burkholderiales bacterium]|nr:aspartate aminotransferase family protein [Burkholderiales bacterium]MDE2431803.1 aspartate aminotransferase family protein [Burkholderiales bacterium]